jgi:von Willebrand factor type A domain
MIMVRRLLAVAFVIATTSYAATSAPTTQPAATEPKTVIYVCNGSTSMKGRSFDLLKGELKKAIEVLPPPRAFDVIFFQNGEAAPFAEQLILASPKNKERAYDFLEHVELKPGGADPLPAMRLALRLKPERIYLLADGPFDDSARVVAEIRALQRAATPPLTRINTIGFFRPDLPRAEREQTEAMLKEIAADTGGTFKTVLTSDLER